MTDLEREQRIFADLDKCAHDLRSGKSETRQWTTRIKDDICSHGEDLGYWAYSSNFSPKRESPKSKRSEWLFDAVWLKYHGETLISIPLALESEWGDDAQIDEDFQKLLVTRAHLRVMVFGDRNADNDDTAERLFFYANNFEQSDGDRYLMAGFESFETGWSIYRFTVGGPLEKCVANSTLEPVRPTFDWEEYKPN